MSAAPSCLSNFQSCRFSMQCQSCISAGGIVFIFFASADLTQQLCWWLNGHKSPSTFSISADDIPNNFPATAVYSVNKHRCAAMRTNICGLACNLHWLCPGEHLLRCRAVFRIGSGHARRSICWGVGRFFGSRRLAFPVGRIMLPTMFPATQQPSVESSK